MQINQLIQNQTMLYLFRFNKRFIIQISLNIQNDVYRKLVNAGVDMQSKFNDYLSIIADTKDTYLISQQFKDDKVYFQEALREVEDGKIVLLSQEEYDEDMNEFIKSL